MAKTSPVDQKLQAVLYAMGVSLGKHGLDGERGPDTNAAVNIGASLIGKTGSPEEMRKALVDQLKDHKFRNAALARLEEMPKNKETTIAMQTVLAAAGHSTLYMRDPVTGLMNGKMNEATKFALENTDNGMPTALVNTPASAIQVARAEEVKRGELNEAFQLAKTATPPAQSATQAPTQSVPTAKVVVAALEKTF